MPITNARNEPLGRYIFTLKRVGMKIHLEN